MTSWKKLSLIGLGVITAFFLLETSLRIYYFLAEKMYFGLTPARTTLEFYDNDIFGSALVPSQVGWFVPHTKEYFTHVEVNSHGFPDVEHTYEKPEGVYRIVVIGDSFVENWQVPLEQRFFRQLEKSLNEANNSIKIKRFEIIAMGRGNTGTAQQYLMLKNYGLKYQPDLVVQMFFEANDVQNNSSILQNDIFLPYFVTNEEGNLVELPHGKRSERKLAGVKELIKSTRIAQMLLSIRQRGIEKKNNLSEGYPVAYHVYDQNYSDVYQKAWETTEKLILETKKETEATGADYLFIPFPGSEQVDLEKQNAIRNAYPLMNSAKLDFEKPDKILSGLCVKNGVDCYSLFPEFKKFIKENPEQAVYFKLDGHWTKTGTNLVYEVMLSKIKALEDKP